ncbi:MAG: hypothetical protein AB7U82_01485 [Blastocatellales bacterium]
MHRIGLIIFISLTLLTSPKSQLVAPVTDAIRAEATRPNDSGDGRPLPLVAHWNTGTEENGFSPDYQMRMIEQGHYLLPWFQMPAIDTRQDDPRWISYYEAAIKQAAQLKLPISFIGTQWEMLLTNDAAYFNLPPADNPNVIGLDGAPRREVSPFGGDDSWREVGRRWTTSAMMKKLQKWYPDPPLVLFISNNEHPKLAWMDVEEERRYLATYGRGQSDNFKRRMVGEAWIERYRLLQEGMRDGLSHPNWRTNARFIGYDAFGPSHFGRWPGWMEHSLYRPGRIDPNPLAWDGGSPSFYLFNWMANADYTVFSPQIEAMNWVFMQKEAYRYNPSFWFEISTWDGHEPGAGNDKRLTYARSGQFFSPSRYAGMIQFGMWLLRPRVVREFRGWLDTLAAAEHYFLPTVEAVDNVHGNPTLREFWRKGNLVANSKHEHPYVFNIPAEYQNAERWFLLDTSLDPPRPWGLFTQLPVFALALVKGAAPERQWLLYAHAPSGDRRSVSITIPDYKQVQVDVSVGGSFYLVDEQLNQVQLAQQSAPAVRRVGRR